MRRRRRYRPGADDNEPERCSCQDPNGCPPCSFCTSLTEEESALLDSGGAEAVVAQRRVERELAQRFRWRCHDGREMLVEEMETRHVFNSLRMIFNALVQPAYRLPGVKVWDIGHKPIYYLRRAVNEFIARLRQDYEKLTDQQVIELAHIIEHVSKIATRATDFTHVVLTKEIFESVIPEPHED